MQFLAVYVREAHPTDGWRSAGNDRVGITIAQPRADEERVAVASKCSATLEITMPLLVDALDDRVGHAYSGMPDRLYVIDRDGRVVYKGGRGPFGFKPAEMEQSLVMLLLDQNGQAKKPVSPSRFPVLSNEEAWKRLPPLVEGKEQPLPVWARTLAGPMPKTTAMMLELDDVQRTKSPLEPQLCERMRYQAAATNRCNYSHEYFDYQAAGLRIAPVPGITLIRPTSPPEVFAQKMCLEADQVTDGEVAELIKEYGEEKVVAMVALLAYANFKDRLILSLGIQNEPGGPLKPLGVKFKREPVEGRAVAPPRKPVETFGPDIASRVTDPDWLAFKFDELQKSMDGQRARQPRIRVPTWEEVKPKLPPGYAANRQVKINWSLVCMGYQPMLSGAWIQTMRAFREDSRQDRVFEETLFWVITRSLHCFY